MTELITKFENACGKKVKDKKTRKFGIWNVTINTFTGSIKVENKWLTNWGVIYDSGDQLFGMDNGAGMNNKAVTNYIRIASKNYRASW